MFPPTPQGHSEFKCRYGSEDTCDPCQEQMKTCIWEKYPFFCKRWNTAEMPTCYDMWPPNLCIARRSPKKLFEPGNVTSAFPFPHLEGKLLFRACMTHRREHLHHPPDLSKFTRLWTLAAWTGAKITAKLFRFKPKPSTRSQLARGIFLK